MCKQSFMLERNWMMLLLCVTTTITLSVACYSAAIAQEWAVNSDFNPAQAATATPANRTRYSPSSLMIQRNALAQQNASILQAIAVAQACIKNNSNPQILRDQEGNVRSAPSTDLSNCIRTLEDLKRRLIANLQAIDNLNQDVQFDTMRAARIKKKADYARQLKRLSMPMY